MSLKVVTNRTSPCSLGCLLALVFTGGDTLWPLLVTNRLTVYACKQRYCL